MLERRKAADDLLPDARQAEHVPRPIAIEPAPVEKDFWASRYHAR